jgi:hypothetical protein
MSMGPNILSSTDEAKTIHSISWWRQVDTWLGTDEAEAIHFHRRILLASNTVMMQHTNVSLMTFIIFCLVPTRLDETPAKHRQDSDHYYTDTFLVNGIECLRCWAPTRQKSSPSSTQPVYPRYDNGVVVTESRQYKRRISIHTSSIHIIRDTLLYDMMTMTRSLIGGFLQTRLCRCN